MTSPENKHKEVQPKEIEESVQLQPEKSQSELNQERFTRVNQELRNLSQRVVTSQEMQQIQVQKEQDYQAKIAEIEEGLGAQLSDESKDMIHKKIVDSSIERA